MADSNNGRRVDLPFLDTTLPFDLAVSRRDMLKIGGAMSLAAFIAACGGSATPAGAWTPSRPRSSHPPATP